MSTTSAQPASTVIENVKSESISSSKGFLDRYTAWRKSFGLPNPGAFEQLHKEVRGMMIPRYDTVSNHSLGVFASSYLFDGAKFDFSKALSQSGSFSVLHSIHLGSQVSPSSYSFGATFAEKRV